MKNFFYAILVVFILGWSLSSRGCASEPSTMEFDWTWDGHHHSLVLGR